MPSYCDLDLAKQQLELSDADPDDADDITELAAIDAEISRTFELKTGREGGFGGTATATAKTIDGAVAGRSDILILPEPVSSVISVVITGYAPETLASTAYILWNIGRFNEALALKRIDGRLWPYKNGIDRVTVTAVWGDAAPGGAVPDAIRDAVTFVVVNTFKQRKSSPSGEIGPEGFSIRPLNPWNYETVKETIKRYSLARSVVF